MNFKYKLEINKNNIIDIKEFKTLKEISKELNIELHIVRKINDLTENRKISIRPHKVNDEIYNKLKIFNIKKQYNI